LLQQLDADRAGQVFFCFSRARLVCALIFGARTSWAFSETEAAMTAAFADPRSLKIALSKNTVFNQISTTLII